MLRNVIRSLARFLVWLFTKLEVAGLENVPRQGGCILAVNHLSRADAALIFALVDRDDVTALVADSYKRRPFFRFLMNGVGVIWINREDADLHAVREARDFLRKGGALGIAPEGTRSRTGEMIVAKTGVAYLADKAGVPVVPVAVSGTENLAHRMVRLQRTPVRMEFGKPFSLPPVDRRNRDVTLQGNTDEIMCRIAVMLPPKYHGVYTGHPCLQELLAATGAAAALEAGSD